jgi:hypothetical protein
MYPFHENGDRSFKNNKDGVQTILLGDTIVDFDIIH